jgi:iron complex outermembrane receptor protein
MSFRKRTNFHPGQTTFDKALQVHNTLLNTVQTQQMISLLLDPYEISGRNMGPSRTLILINGKRKLKFFTYVQTS